MEVLASQVDYGLFPDGTYSCNIPEDDGALTFALPPAADRGTVHDNAEGYNVFLSTMGEGEIAKLSTRKSKKILKMERRTDEDDHRGSDIIKNKNSFQRIPFGCRSVLKQLFGGRFGLTILACVYSGFPVGKPLDVLDGWDATLRTGQRTMDLQFQSEDPYCTIVTHPCGPWGNWSRAALGKGGAAAATILEAREHDRPILKLVSRAVEHRVGNSRRVFLEHPLGSEAINQPEMKPVKDMILNGTLFFIRADGCMLGY